MSSLKICRQPGRVVKGIGIMIDMASVQNLLAPFSCVLGKDFPAGQEHRYIDKMKKMHNRMAGIGI